MIPFSKAYIGRKEYKAVKRVLKSGWLTTGKVTEQFEKEFADYVGAKYAVAVSSCTMALEIALGRLNLHKNDLVLVPSFTFCATAQAVIHAGGTPVFGDISDSDLCLDPNSFLVKTVLPMCKAVVPVHLGGNEAFTDYKLPVVEDSAHRIERNQCLNNKNTVCFSFYPTKNMTTGEGGMICTNNKEDYEWFLKARSHGRSKLVGHGYTVDFNGLKGNLPDILSAIGLEQVRKLEKMTKMRNRAVELYNTYLGTRWTGNHLFPLFIENRDDFIEFMKSHGVQCSAHFSALHKMPAFKKYNKIELPVTERLSETEVSLPLFPELKERQIKEICELVFKWEELGKI